MFYNKVTLLAQQGIIIERSRDLEAIQNSSFVFNGPQFFAAVIAGIVLAFAFQLLFTNLGVAVGISLAGGSSSSSSTSDYDSDSGGLGSTIKKVGMAVGLGTLISVSLALFIASLLAVKLGLYIAPLSGAIVGLVIWAAFFALMMFFSSRTIGSLLGSVFSTATAGMQSILGTATAAIAAGAASEQVVNTAEAATAAVKRELGMAIDPISMKENVEEFLQSVKPAGIDVNQIAQDFEQLLDDENLQSIVDSDRIHNIDRHTFIKLISDRSDISRQDAERIATKMESVWHKTTSKFTPAGNPVTDFANYLKTATKEQLTGTDFGSKLDSVVSQINPNNSSNETNPLVRSAVSFGASSLANIVIGRADLSDFDVDRIVSQLKSAGLQLGEQTDKVAYKAGIKKTPPTTIEKDIDNYLANAYPWQLKQVNLDREFRDLIYDPAADPQAVVNELRQLNRTDFVEVLTQKGLLSQAQIRSIANILDAIRLEVIATAEAAQARESSIELMVQVEEYLTSVPKNSLTPETIQLEFKPILEDFDATYEQLTTRLGVLDRPTLERMLELRNDMNQVEISAIAGELEIARDQVLKNSHQNVTKAKAVADRQWLQIQSYLRNTGKGELNPDGIQRELELLFKDPQAGSSALRARLEKFDRDTLVQLLSQRQDLRQSQVEDIIDTVEGSWMRIAHAPQKLAGKAKEQYDIATSEIASYLRKTGKPELNPRGIEQDLTLLFNNPKLGSKAIRQRLAAMDRDTLVQLLAQRQDLSEADIDRVINDVQSTLRKIVKAPRRAAIRTQEKVQDFSSAIADYLRDTDKAELSPGGIKRDLKLLLNDPRAGAESLKDRLASFNRSTLTALLTQRDDISQADVDLVVDQILEVRDSIMSQLQMVQDKVQSVIDRLLAKIKAYLDSLDRPELAYAGIKRDINLMFDDPQAGFTALRDRFSKVDRNTMLAIMSSRQDISAAEANQIITQIERTRDRALQRAERIQTEAGMRLESAKKQAAMQVEETRKAAATASWWLFITGLVSAIASASAGVIGVMG
ncbi:MFS transporter [Waterburya agarophytonicola K14]|uniref:MFS transporter n=1 Tax=Waterburya agarophytonicola KI4 TaxID=2874699 RepID=A0A964C0D2_9CYAN|nr:YrzE family protein [Waterburya agarophytonicola]MCC0179836.1 MFS transporter [Waterburya agarophytonicola KI4]